MSLLQKATVFIIVILLLVSGFFAFGFESFSQLFAHSVKAADLVSPIKNADQMLSADSPKPLPDVYKLPTVARKQIYKLSCEFAAAVTILDYYLEDPLYEKQNQKAAEEILIQEIGISKNPDIGIRMGKALPGDRKELLSDFNKPIGGTYYYGVHAPPFISLFEKKGFVARPITNATTVMQDIKQAISSNHLIMVWMYLLAGQKIDVILDSGEVAPLVRGEHVAVLTGYDSLGVTIMDPSDGKEKYFLFKDFKELISKFEMPLLEIYPQDSSNMPSVLGIETVLFQRKSVKVLLTYAKESKNAAQKVAPVLQALGYTLTVSQNADSYNGSGLSIRLKPALSEYINTIKKDLAIPFFPKPRVFTDIQDNNSYDMMVFVGI